MSFHKPYVELTKPRITWLILVSTAIGFAFGLQQPLDWWTLFHTLIGTALIASGTATLNQWYERHSDALMRRTQNRPIPSGRVSASAAFAWGVFLSIAGYVQLAFGVNWLAANLGLFTLASYLFVYTPLKQVHWHATTVGAIPGAMPPVIGYAASAGALNMDAAALFAILFLWQFPHFYAIAWLHREDYAKAGIRMLPVVEPDGDSTARQILLTSLILIPVSLLPKYLGMVGNIYTVGAVLLGLLFLWSGMRLIAARTLHRARGVLLASVVYLPVLYGLLLFDRL
jgi:protoheme IX farnesyltransferase